MGRPKGSKNKPKHGKGGSPPGVKSPRHSAAARANGKKGGRPTKGLPVEMLRSLGPAPVTDPLRLARWYTAALGLLSQLRLEGVSGIDALADEIRKNASAAGRVLPHDIIFSAARVVRDDEDEMAADGGPEDEEVIDAEEVTPMEVRAVG